MIAYLRVAYAEVNRNATSYGRTRYASPPDASDGVTVSISSTLDMMPEPGAWVG